jgi:DNA polymerase III subunit epsilon
MTEVAENPPAVEQRKLPPFGINMHAPWSTLPLAVIDFETDGANLYGCEPVQLGIVRYEANGGPYKETGSFSTLLNPGRPIDPGATEIHKITDAMVADAMTAEQLFSESVKARIVFQLLEGALPVAFNAPFDRTIWLRKASAVPEETAPAFDRSLPWLCPLVLLRVIDRYAKGAGRFKLENACVRHGVPFNQDDAHDALYDCRATAGLLQSFLSSGKIKGHARVHDMLTHIEQQRAFQEADFRNFRIKVTTP